MGAPVRGHALKAESGWKEKGAYRATIILDFAAIRQALAARLVASDRARVGSCNLIHKARECPDEAYMRVNFKEIPESTGGPEVADTWMLFARDFMIAFGFEPESGSDRGADDGRDLIVVGRYSGPLGQSASRWVVSCKHKAHSGEAVSDREEIDPTGRVHQFHADGFIAFYSTLPGEALGRAFERSRSTIPVEVFDAARIEHELLGNPALEAVFKRYFPQSHDAWAHS